jgi:hypothetical protein
MKKHPTRVVNRPGKFYVELHWWVEGPRYLFVGLFGQQNEWLTRTQVARMRATHIGG